MPEPIPPIKRIRHEDMFVRGRIEMAVVVICPDGWPYHVKDRRYVFEHARDLANESLTRRRISTPPSGWRLALVQPDEIWQRHLSEQMVVRVGAELEREPKGAAVAVVVVYEPEEEPQWIAR